ncbi:hypothetical protein HMPREF9123_0247 [Neisseria bacilliformis ATCC BAA-1200]|uniref:Uncharacterized protein n=1 Tax=Neisseria bacilliformis ATCC BAA-1200 TaxID=888742 RepID=F2B973_9NEIS|nr:hypothetical protein HMPREF9123_0247 [Neisseria bacilliformis ATCC BAA-1200]
MQCNESARFPQPRNRVRRWGDTPYLNIGGRLKNRKTVFQTAFCMPAGVCLRVYSAAAFTAVLPVVFSLCFF